MTTQLNFSLLYFPLNAISPYTKLIVPFPSKKKKKKKSSQLHCPLQSTLKQTKGKETESLVSGKVTL